MLLSEVSLSFCLPLTKGRPFSIDRRAFKNNFRILSQVALPTTQENGRICSILDKTAASSKPNLTGWAQVNGAYAARQCLILKRPRAVLFLAGRVLSELRGFQWGFLREIGMPIDNPVDYAVTPRHGTLQLFHEGLAISPFDNEIVARHCRDAINQFSIIRVAKLPKKFRQIPSHWFAKY